MPRNIPRQARYRPFDLKKSYPEISAAALTVKAEEVKELIDDEFAFLNDTHASVTYSFYERTLRSRLCQNILRKLAERVKVRDLTPQEAGFIQTLVDEKRAHEPH